MRRSLAAVVLAAALAGLAYGYRHALMQASGMRNALGQHSGAYFRTEVPCPGQTQRSLVVVALGQSNASSTAEGATQALANVLNFYDGRCFRAEDPLLGTDGRGASVWIAMANSLAARHDYVILVPFAVGNTSIRRWNGDIGVHLQRSLAVVARGYKVTHFLWHQGEADAAMSATEYAARLRKVIDLAKGAFPAASFYVALASRCGSTPRDNGARGGQRAVVDPHAGIFQGPDTDAIDERYDGCHFADAGRRRAAALWASVISQ
jgi:hypothetical protein